VIEENKTKINSTGREVQKVFKYIVNGPKNKKEEAEEQDDIMTDNNKVFDDIHVIIWINKLLQSEKKV